MEFASQFQNNKLFNKTLIYIQRGLIKESKEQNQYIGQCACFHIFPIEIFAGQYSLLTFHSFIIVKFKFSKTIKKLLKFYKTFTDGLSLYM